MILIVSIIKVCFVTSLVEIGKTALEEKVFKFRQYTCIFAISLFRNSLPLEKGPLFEQT